VAPRDVSTRATRSTSTRRVATTRRTGGDDFAPGTLMSKIVDASANAIDWERLVELRERVKETPIAGATQPTLGLIAGELELVDGDVDALRARAKTRYKEYVLSRTLAMKSVVTVASSEAGIVEPKLRCAVGRTLSDVASENSLFAVFARRATRRVDDFSRGVGEDLEIILRDASEEHVSRTKNFYGEHVSAEYFAFVRAQVEACANAAATEGARGGGGAVKVKPILIPSMDVVADDDSSDGGEGDFMFGKKSKKKKKKKTSAPSSADLGLDKIGINLGERATKTLTKMLGDSSAREPAFPEVESWGQTTSGEATGAAFGVLARAPKNVAVVFPSELMRSALTFDAETNETVNSLGARAFSAEHIARDPDAWREKNEDVVAAIWIDFDDGRPAADAADDTFARAFTTLRDGAKIPIVYAAVTLLRECGEACDPVSGPPRAVAAAAAASGRAHARVAALGGDDA